MQNAYTYCRPINNADYQSLNAESAKTIQDVRAYTLQYRHTCLNERKWGGFNQNKRMPTVNGTHKKFFVKLAES